MLNVLLQRYPDRLRFHRHGECGDNGETMKNGYRTSWLTYMLFLFLFDLVTTTLALDGSTQGSRPGQHGT